MNIDFLAAFAAGFLLLAAANSAHALEFNPGDYAGQDLIITHDTTLGGVYTNVGHFVIQAGVKVSIEPYSGPCAAEVRGGRLEVHAERIEIQGKVDGDGMGYTGGGGAGGGTLDTSIAGIGGEPVYTCEGDPGEWRGELWWSGTGQDGGKGDGPREGNNDDLATEMGRGGDGGSTSSPTWVGGNPGEICVRLGGPSGGCGGAAIRFFADSVTVSGEISLNGRLGYSNNGVDGGSAQRTQGTGDFNLTPIAGRPTCAEAPYWGGDYYAKGLSGSGGDMLLYARQSLSLAPTARLTSLAGAIESRLSGVRGGVVKLRAQSMTVDPAAIIAAEWLDRKLDYLLPANVSFAGDIHEWNFGSAPEFDSPWHSLVSQGLQMTATDLWQFLFVDSPTFKGGAPDQIYRARFHVSSDAAAKMVPTFRLRAFERDFTQTASVLITSSTGLLSPGSEGRDFDITYASSPFGGASQRFAFDMLHFSLDDATTATLLLKNFSTAPEPIVLADVRSEKVYTFDSGPEGWDERWVGDWRYLRQPEYPTAAGWIGLSAVRNGTPLYLGTFGYWASPADVVLDPSRLYRITFNVESDLPLADRSRVPTFRCRVNETGLDAAATLDVASQGEALRSPTAGAPQDYVIYFQPTAATSARKLLISFDILYFNPGDNREATLRLNEVRVESAIAQ